jgi:3-methyladenine DNA glycosylase/8-oxoguanine DNA glycosylase
MIELRVPTAAGYRLAETCAPVAWASGRWPNQDWISGELISVARDGDRCVVRWVGQNDVDSLTLRSTDVDADHAEWAARVLGVKRVAPQMSDAVIAEIASRFPGMRPFSNGALFDGIVTAIVGQSISVQAAAVTERKLAALFSAPVVLADRPFWPLPSAEQLANGDPAVVRQSGVTQRRADAIVAIARSAVAGLLPNPTALSEPGLIAALLNMPLVGRWTAESVLLWGLGTDDAFPAGDVALLRAARKAYRQPEMTHGDLGGLSDGWRPGRSWAARWLWLDLFGPAADAGLAR